MGQIIGSSLLRKAVAVVVVVFGLTLAALTGSSAWRIETNMTQQSESRGAAIANGLASSGVEVLLFGDVATIQSMIDQYLEIEGVGYVFVVSPEGEFLAHTFVPTVPLEVRGLRGKLHEPAIQEVSIGGLGDFIDVSSPILEGEVGYVHVGMDRQPIRAAIGSAIVNQVVLIAAIFGFSLLTAALLMNKIVGPLRKLRDYAKTLAAGGSAAGADVAAREEVAAIAARSDEVGQLAVAFRYLVDRVASREKELRDAHRDLELRVRARTAELTAATESLQREIAERQQAENDLQQKTTELERFNRLAVNREQRMIDLKRQVNQLALALGQPAPYDLAFMAEAQARGPT